MCDLSVIVPVYNVEKYLRQCIDSILAQSFKSMEIILVNDGSPDKCGEICDEYSRKYNNIKVIHKANGGLSSARNAGLEIAQGEYIGFVDSDDFIKEDMYEKLCNCAKKNNADFVGCAHEKMDGEGNWILYPSYLPEGVYNKEDMKERFIKELFGSEGRVSAKNVGGNVTFGICRRSVIKNNNLSFQSERLVLCEDEVFLFDFFRFAETSAFIEDALYCYRYNENSLVHCYRKNKWETVRTLMGIYRKEAKAYGLEEECRSRINNYEIGLLLTVVCNECRKDSGMTMKQKKDRFRLIFNDDGIRKLAAENIEVNERRIVKIFIHLLKKNQPVLCCYLFHIFIHFKGGF